MVLPAAGADRGLLERAQQRRGLAGIEDHGAAALGARGFDEAGGERRDPGEVTEQVEGDALAGEQGPRRTGDDRDLPWHGLRPGALDDELVERARTGLAERLGGDVEAGDDAGLLLDDLRAPPRIGRDGRVAGQVAIPEVLGERRRHELADRGVDAHVAALPAALCSRYSRTKPSRSPSSTRWASPAS